MQPINWPIEALNIVPPIIFIVLIVAFPLIGLAAGWKRAAFWGGGNLLFYIIGLLIWRFAGAAIIAPFKDKIIELIQQLVEGLVVTDQLIASILAPVWFLIWMFASEIILLINYYAWYKRVTGLKKIGIQDKKTGKIKKQYTKVSPKAGTVGYKVGNRIGGVLLLGALTVPTSMAFTQTMYCALTSSTTRKANNLSDNLYKGIEKLNDGPFNWLSFMPTSCHDFDAIYAGFAAMSTEVEITYIDPQTQEEKTVTGNIIQVAEEAIGASVTEIMTDFGEGTQPSKQDIGNTVNAVGDVWNQLNQQAPEVLESIFNSGNATELVGQMLNIGVEETFEIDDTTFNNIFAEETGFLDQILTEFQSESHSIGGVVINDITPIVTSQECIDNLSNIFLDKIDTSGLSGSDEEKAAKEAAIKETMDGILKILFQAK